MRRSVFWIIPLFWLGQLATADSRVLVWKLDQDLETAYTEIYKALEKNRFYVVFEPNIQRNLSGFAERWGEDYNRSGLENLRAMVFCNAWYANKVSNLDPDMLGFCPLHITLVERLQDGGARTTVLFNRPTAMTAGSAAHELLGRIEAEVIAAIEKGLAMLESGPAGKQAGTP